MFNRKADYFVLFVALASLTVSAFATQYVISGEFKERRTIWEHGYITGTLYYLYDTETPDNSRLRLEYKINDTFTVSNLYQYTDKAVYSMCSKCTGLYLKSGPDPWWFVDGLFTEGEAKDGMRWYVRVNASSSTQVQSILIKQGATAPSAGFIKAVNFTDGRQLVFTSSVIMDETHPANDPIFSAAENCPKPSCPIFADIIFVLDSSGSVNNTEWAQSVKFVGQIMDSFTFGRTGVAAAVVQFAGQTTSPARTKKIYNDPLCGTATRFYGDYGWPTNKTHPNIVKWPDIMWSVLASEDYGEGETVSYNKDQIMSNLRSTLSDSCFMVGKDCQAFPHGPRGTCQALGLKAAVEMLDRSPRAKNFTTKPNRIVIVVTDGEEKFPNSTQGNATLLRDQGTLLIEVGVGLACEYDKTFLKNISSKLGSDDSVAYFDVNDYDQIMKVADKMFRPICDSNFSSTECGPDCGGFCGCGFCLCPTCDESEDSCHVIQCSVNHQISNGCVVSDAKYEIDDDKCTTWKCNSTKLNETSGSMGYWEAHIDPCDDARSKNPGACRIVYCDPKYGGCRVEINETYCDQFSNSCEKYECTPVGEDPEDLITGCKLSKNYTQNCIDNLGPKAACFEIVCDPNGGNSDCDKMLVDTCSSLNNACEHYACTLDAVSGEYTCTSSFTRSHVNTSCVEWECNYSGTEGWKVAVDRDDDNYCQNFFNASLNISSKCKIFYCDPDKQHDPSYEGGCFYENRSGCRAECSDEKEILCMKYGFGNSTDDNCIFDFCYVNHTEGDNYIPVCASEMNESRSENCLASTSKSAKKARELNEAYPDQCWTPVCKLGGCGYEKVDLPSGWKWDNCSQPRCEMKADGSWGWVMKSTPVKDTCLSDACYIRECIPDMGCVATENCVKFSDECYKYTCVLNNVTNKPEKCEMTNLTVNFLHLECIEEKCVDGKKITKYPECVPTDKCTRGLCVGGYCEYEPLPPPEDDPCLDYTCDNGNWTATPKCVDDRYCTEDECWDYGSFIECHFNQIDCNERITMQTEDGRYDCFRARCIEQPKEGNFRCMRKIIKGAYIDICGRCIQDDPFAEYSSEESVTSEENSGLVCTGAPPKPLMVEALAAGTIGLIIIAAVVVGAALTTSSIVATKTLVNRVKDASNQSAQSNPLFEGVETELQNPTYAGGVK